MEGFQLRQMMTMMRVRVPLLPAIDGEMGFEKEVDFVSCYLAREHSTFLKRPRKWRGAFGERQFPRGQVLSLEAELKRYAVQFGQTYNKTFVNNWKYYPLTRTGNSICGGQHLTVAVPQYIKFIAHGDDLVGFLLGFPDISSALQRQGGRITPWGLADIMLEFKKTRFISLNGVGVLPE